MRRATSRNALPETADLRPSPKMAHYLQFKHSLSVTPIDAKPALSGHGGARLRADRTSDHLSLRQARRIMLSALAAERLGQPFTRFVTVHWERIGIGDAQAADATGRLVKLAKDWARKRGGSILWAWVRENGIGKGSHVHMLLACRPELPIGRMWRRWLQAITGRPYRAGTIHTRRIGGTLRAAYTNPAAYHAALSNVVAYVCKGVRADDAQALGLHRLETGGEIIGKRAAWSQGLPEL